MKQSNRNPWDVLNISTSATQEEIKQAFKKLAMKHHPDRGGNAVEFNRVVVAYEKLRKNSIVPIIEAQHTHLVNVKLTIQQQIEGVDDFIETSTGEVLKVTIPMGAKKDDKYKVKTAEATYIINVKELSHKTLTRQGFSLIMDLPIDITDAMCGNILLIEGPCGESTEIAIAPGTVCGTIIVIPGMGLVNKLTKQRGGLHVRVNTAIPTLDTDDSIAQFITRLKNVRN